MKKLVVFALLMLSVNVNAQFIQKGYHGFADVGYCIHTSQMTPSTFEVTTSHGYYFNPYIFLGAGLGFDFTGKCEWGEVGGRPYLKRDSKVDIPIFFNAHGNLTKTKLSPFADIKVGAYVNNDGKLYFNAGVGCRYAINDNMGISLSVSYELRKVTVERITMTTPSKYNKYDLSYYYTERPNEPLDCVVIKAGFDF